MAGEAHDMNPVALVATVLGLALFIARCVRTRLAVRAEMAAARQRHPSARQPARCPKCDASVCASLAHHYRLAHVPAPVDIVDR